MTHAHIHHSSPPPTRVELLEELYRLYGSGSGTVLRGRYLRKKYGWICVTNGAKILKRIIDITGACIGLFITSPLFIIVPLCIRFTDGGPALFVQKRVGLYGKEFSFPKFRSMRVNADALKDSIREQSHHENSITFKMKEDPRVTWIGRIIRKTSIDELPQLWTVLTGDMSLVGPRPPLPDEVAHYTLAERRRLDVYPGLTCIWQIKGRGDIPFNEQVALDLQYIESRSIWGDIVILVKTIPAVLLGRGAY